MWIDVIIYGKAIQVQKINNHLKNEHKLESKPNTVHVGDAVISNVEEWYYY